MKCSFSKGWVRPSALRRFPRQRAHPNILKKATSETADCGILLQDQYSRAIRPKQTTPVKAAVELGAFLQVKIVGIDQLPRFPFPLFHKLSPDTNHSSLSTCATGSDIFIWFCRKTDFAPFFS